VAAAIRDDGGTAKAFTADPTDERQVAGVVAAVAPTPRPRPLRSARPAAWPANSPVGITVNTVAPGFIPVERHAGIPPETRKAYLATVSAGRMGTPRTSPTP
jgi:hypothetical protein